MPKRSRLAEEKSPVWLSSHSIAGPKKCLRDGHSNAGQFGFRMCTVDVHFKIGSNQFVKTFNIVLHCYNLF
jgi:hypothetical protein